MKYFLLFVLFFQILAVSGQQIPNLPVAPGKKCATDEIHQWRLVNEPGYAEAYQALQDYTAKFVAEHPAGYSPKAVVTIPVVFHIVLSPAQHATFLDSRCLEQIDVLNQDYAGLNTHSIAPFPASMKTNTELQFCLATIDPSGQPTSGIERRDYSGSGWGTNSGVKYYAQGGLDAWDNTKYLNFWICDLGGGLCGYALYPTSSPEYGLVNHYTYTGVTGASAPYNLGGTGTHEIGHCFNLKHIWADSPGCSPDDDCNDTPLQDEEQYGNPTAPLFDACTPSGNGINFQNFMDYVDDIAYANFTPDQKTRIQACFASGGPLYQLGQSAACGVTINADFVGTPTTINVGQNVDFTDLSTGNPTTWSWTFTGAVAGSTTSTLQNPQNIQYDVAGWYPVSLTASNSNFSNTATKTQYIHVIDPNLVDADFVGNPTTLYAGNTVQFTDLSTSNPISWSWSFQGGTPAISTLQNPLITYNTPGTYNVTLTASKTGTTDTETKTGYITVVDPASAPEADFVADYTIIPAGASINFYNYSSGIYDSLRWFFQDAVTATSTVSNPTLIQYDNIGNWDVTLVLYSQLGNDTLTKVGYIMVVPPGFGDTLTADFHAITGRLIPQGWSVSYEDLSEGYPTSWYWIFEGGTPNSSTVQNPQNITYSTPGIFDVRLIVNNGISSDTLFKDNYIVVTTEPWPDPNGYCEDTVINVLTNERPLTFRHLIPNKWGYFPGHNEYQVKAYAEKFTFYTFNKVTGLIVPVVKAFGATSASKVRFTVWDVDANGKPGTELANKDVLINTFTPYFYHSIMFNTPAPVDGHFFVGYQIWYNTPLDTFVVYMAPNRGVGGNNTVYCKKGAAWFSPSALLNDTLNTSLALRILGCLYNSEADINWDDHLMIYPNPTDGQVFMQILGVEVKTIQFHVFDITGRAVNPSAISDDNANHRLDFAGFENGIYFIRTIINGQPVTRKITLMK
jgi:PKD repeat protein